MGADRCICNPCPTAFEEVAVVPLVGGAGNLDGLWRWPLCPQGAVAGDDCWRSHSLMLHHGDLHKPGGPGAGRGFEPLTEACPLSLPLSSARGWPRVLGQCRQDGQVLAGG